LAKTARVLDVGCGDGFYTALFADRLISPGVVVGLDRNQAYLEMARQRFSHRPHACDVNLVVGQLQDASLPIGDFDLAWCAQCLYSLPEPVAALRQMAERVRPGGTIAVLENDTLHQLLLPWPPHIELALHEAERQSLVRQSSSPGKYYVGRRLPAVLDRAGIEPLGFKTQAIDRMSPLDADSALFLQLHFDALRQRVSAYLDPALAAEFDELISPHGPRYLLRQPYFTASWINVLAWGRRRMN
jgi:SAM-dependent methyltransferase